MTKKKKTKQSKKRSSPGKNILMTLTLVPVVIGVLLLGAWAMDLEILENQSEVQVGIFFLLLGFAASNALQKRSRLAIGWGTLAIADLILLTWFSILAQGVAIAVGLIGSVILGIEFYKQYQQNKMDKASKKV